MNKSKTKKLVLLATVGIVIFSFIPAAAASQGSVTKRPIDDWLDAQWTWALNELGYDVENWAFSDFFSSYNFLVCKMGLPWPKAGLPWAPGIKYDMVYENSLVDGATIITGSITERTLNYGSALITLHLDVKNAPLTVYDYFDFIGYCFNITAWHPNEGIPPTAILGEGIDGYIDYKVVCKFIIPFPGAAMPDVFMLWDNYISVNIVGTGYGILTGEGGFTPGAKGMVKLHQIALYKPDLKDDHPKYDPDYGDLWPVETIEIHEIG